MFQEFVGSPYVNYADIGKGFDKIYFFNTCLLVNAFLLWKLEKFSIKNDQKNRINVNI